MQTKNAMTVLGTIIFLIGVFGYIFPEWNYTRFTNNENLIHVVMGLILLMTTPFNQQKRLMVLVLSALIFLALGLAGFSLTSPDYFVNNRLILRHDEVDNYLHCVIALALAWTWLKNRRTV